jgi:phage anti-repressor protein
MQDYIKVNRTVDSVSTLVKQGYITIDTAMEVVVYEADKLRECNRFKMECIKMLQQKLN